MSEKEQCCCENNTKGQEMSPCCCDMGASVIDKLDTKPMLSDCNNEIPDLISSAADTFAMERKHCLTVSAEGLWNLYKEVIDAVFENGWNNPKHPWAKNLQDFWRYPLAFADYAIPSLIIIEPERYEEAIKYMKKSILLMKDTPLWDDWIRQGHGDDPVSKANIMYKGHLNLMYGLYQLVSGSIEFEREFQSITDIITSEYTENIETAGYCGIECEPDQWFPQCNSMGMMSMRVRDAIYGTKLDKTFSYPIEKFISERVSDPESGMIFAKYHPSHDQAEAYLTGFCNSWALTMLKIYNPEKYTKAYKNFIKGFLEDIMGGKAAYLKEYMYSKEPSTGLEESMGVFYMLGLAKEYNDVQVWEKISRYFISVYGITLEDSVIHLKKATPEDETFVSNYLFWGNVHLGWDKVLNYDWKQLRKNREEVRS